MAQFCVLGESPCYIGNNMHAETLVGDNFPQPNLQGIFYQPPTTESGTDFCILVCLFDTYINEDNLLSGQLPSSTNLDFVACTPRMRCKIGGKFLITMSAYATILLII
jgi:hypothetical protein